MKSDRRGEQSLPDVTAPKGRGPWQTPRIEIVTIGEVTRAKGAAVTEGATTRAS